MKKMCNMCKKKYVKIRVILFKNWKNIFEPAEAELTIETKEQELVWYIYLNTENYYLKTFIEIYVNKKYVKIRIILFKN